MTQTKTIALSPSTIGCGIYRIRCLVNDRTYIGQTARAFVKRWGEHRDDCTRGTHANYKLQYDWMVYGADAFKFEVIELCEYDRLFERERHWILREKPYYNIDLPAQPKGKEKSKGKGKGGDRVDWGKHFKEVGAIVGAFVAYYFLFVR